MMLLGVTFEARNINGLNCEAIIGYPSPMTFLSFGRAMRRAIEAEANLGSEFPSMLILHHDFSLVGHRKSKFEFQPSKTRSGSRTQDNRGEPISEDVLAHIKATVVFEVDGIAEVSALKSAVCRWFGVDPSITWGLQPAYRRFAGGMVERARVFTADSLDGVRKNIPASRLFSGVDGNPVDGPFDAVANYIHNVSPEKDSGFRIPTMLGYAMLETPVFREGTRDPTCKHVFAEPVMGRAAFLSPSTENMKQSFWRLEQKNNAFLCTTGTPFTAVGSL